MKIGQKVVFPIYHIPEYPTEYRVGRIVAFKQVIRGLFNKRGVDTYAVKLHNQVYWRDEDELAEYK